MTECPTLTKLTEDTMIITARLYFELRVSTYDRSPGTKVRVSCRSGLELVGPPDVTCDASGDWSANPYCKEASRVTDNHDDDDSLKLVVILAVISVLVVAVIIFIALLLLRNRRHSKTMSSVEESPYDETIPKPVNRQSRHVEPYYYDDNISLQSQYNDHYTADANHFDREQYDLYNGYYHKRTNNHTSYRPPKINGHASFRTRRSTPIRSKERTHIRSKLPRRSLRSKRRNSIRSVQTHLGFVPPTSVSESPRRYMSPNRPSRSRTPGCTQYHHGNGDVARAQSEETIPDRLPTDLETEEEDLRVPKSTDKSRLPKY